MKNSIYIPVLVLLIACGQQAKTKEEYTIINGNQYITISTDTAVLSKLINIQLLKPDSVRFKYIFFNNSGQDQRLSIPGPSDSYLQAILYFDAATFEKAKGKYTTAGYSQQQSIIQDFNFDWLENDVKEELLQSDSNYHGHPDWFFGGNNKIWLLHNKLLLSRSTN
jgi:hypothetical protein